MFAVIETGGKQYRVAVNDVIKVEKLPGEAGETVTLDRVLMHGGDGGATLGTPVVSGAVVTAEILEQFRDKKVIAFKKRRRKHSSKTKKGHRQYLTRLRIAGLPGDEDGSKSTAAQEKARAERRAAAEAEAEDTAAPEAHAEATKDEGAAFVPAEESPVAEQATEAAAPDAPVTDAPASPAEMPDELDGKAKPANLMAEAPDQVDDLTKLPGIGVASQRQLNSIGVYTYAQFSDWGPEDWDYVESYVETNLEGRVDLERASIMVQVNKLLEGQAASGDQEG